MTGSGTVTLNGTGGGAGGSGGNNYGIILDAGTISASTGNVSITGQGGNGASSNGTLFADSAHLTSTGSANITITGIAGATSSTGIWSSGGSNTLGGNSMTGNLTLIADGITLGNMSMSTSGIATLKPYTPSTSISINGAAGAFGDANSDFLALFNTSTVAPSRAVIGDAVAGTGNVNAGGTWNISSYPFPIYVYGGTLSTHSIVMGGYDLFLDALTSGVSVLAGSSITKSTGADANLMLEAYNSVRLDTTTITSNKLNVTLDSDRGGTGGADNLYLSSITSNNGNIILGGGVNPVTGPAVGTPTYNSGVMVQSGALYAGTGNIIFTGTGWNDGSTSGEAGIVLQGSLINTTSGNITLNGTGGPGVSNNFGVSLGGGAIVSSSAGAISLTGTAGNGVGNHNVGVNIASSSQVNTTGNATISITGTGAGQANAYGIMVTTSGAISGQNGNVSLTGQGGSNLHSYDDGIVIWNISGYSFPITVYGGSVTTGSITGGSKALLLDALNGNVTINSGAVLTSTSNGTGLTLVASQNFINNSSSSALNDTNGRWLVYSTNPANNVLNGLTAGFYRYSCTYGGSCPSFLATGNGLLYSYTPTLIATPSTVNVIYGDTVPNLSGYAYTLSGYLGSDTGADSVMGSLTGATSYAQYDNVGNYNINYSSGTLASALGYAFTYANKANAVVVAAKTLTANLTGLVDKVYDQTTAATLAAGNYSLSGVVNGDTVSVSNISGTYDTKSVGTNKTVTVNGLSLSGTGAGNYVLASNSTSGAVGEIDPATLTVTANNQSRSVGQSNPIFTGSIIGFKGSNNSSVLTALPTYSTTVTTGSPAGAYSIMAGGAAASNYIFTYVNGTLTITGGNSRPTRQQVTIQDVPLCRRPFPARYSLYLQVTSPILPVYSASMVILHRSMPRNTIIAVVC